MRASNDKQQSAFSQWLRTGRPPADRTAEGIELKFNPWHDPSDGRFTYAGSGRYYGAGGGRSIKPAVERPLTKHDRDHIRASRTATPSKVEARRVEGPVRDSARSESPGANDVRAKPRSAPLATSRPHSAAEFVRGVGEGLYDVLEGTVAGTYSALTTNPLTTARDIGRGIAGTIDAVIAAEDTPARVQVSRAADAIAHASARDIGRATGSVAGNVALAVVPGAAVSKVSAARRLRAARPRATYDPPQIGWVKENLKSDEPWRVYNDTAPGARAGQAPTLMRTLSDGTKRPVKFDGVEGDFLIDRKWAVIGKPRAIQQILRQSEVLAQHRLIAVWEVPTLQKRNAAVKLLKKLNVVNIKVRVVKP